MVDRCTFLISVPDKVALPSQAELQAELESTDVSRKVAALKKAILLLQSGEDMPRNLMTVIRYCITVEDHTLQKLLMLYWEVARKYDAGGKLLPEMILVWCVPSTPAHATATACRLPPRLLLRAGAASTPPSLPPIVSVPSAPPVPAATRC